MPKGPSLISPASNRKVVPLVFDPAEQLDDIDIIPSGVDRVHPQVEVYRSWRAAQLLLVLGLMNLCAHFVLLHELTIGSCIFSNDLTRTYAPTLPAMQPADSKRLWAEHPMAAVFGDSSEIAATAITALQTIQLQNAAQANDTAAAVDMSLTREGTRWRLNGALHPPRPGAVWQPFRRLRLLGTVVLPSLGWRAYFACLTPIYGVVPPEWRKCLLYQLGLRASNQTVALSYDDFHVPVLFLGNATVRVQAKCVFVAFDALPSQ
jgi:hypothetical protein